MHQFSPFSSVPSMTNLRTGGYKYHRLHVHENDSVVCEKNIIIQVQSILIAFLARLHFSAEELLLYPDVGVRVGVSVHMQNVRANVKVLEF